MEDSLIRALTVDGDSTGIANLRSDGSQFFDQYAYDQTNGRVKLYFKHFGADNYGYYSCVSVFTDNRDGNIYKAVCIGNQTWMAENLRYAASGSVCYPGVDCRRYGRLYDWNTLMQGANATDAVPSGVQGVCPKGWHVPSIDELGALVQSSAVGGMTKAGGALKATTDWDSPNTGATDKFGFTALPGGYYSPDPVNEFQGQGLIGYWWSTTASIYPGDYQLMYMTNNYEGAPVGGDLGQDIKLSCRCVKDK
jgi:uncharacterized protein (TIGR02145 family)